MFVSTYEDLAEHEDAGQHLQATAWRFHNRSQTGKAFDGSTPAMNLFRRVGNGQNRTSDCCQPCI